MKDLSYPMYVENEAVHEELEREVRRLRAETVQAGLRALTRAFLRRVSVFNLKTA
jgi:hypothetical protein